MCFLGGWPTLGRESEIAGDGFGVDALRLNHFDGLVRNCVNPDEGETERGIPAPAALFGARASCGLSELGGLARRGAINGAVACPRAKTRVEVGDVCWSSRSFYSVDFVGQVRGKIGY